MSEIPPPRSASLAAHFEDGLAAIAALLVVALPLADIVLLRLFSSSLRGAALFTTHLTLIVGMAGAAIAAREGKLLSLATGSLLPAGPIRSAAAVVAALVGSGVAAVLAFGGVDLLLTHHDNGKPLALGIPVWIVDLAFPIAFGLIALRLVWKASASNAWRGVAALGIAGGVWLSWHPGLLEGVSAWPGLIVLVVAAICGMPIFGLLGGAAVLLLLVDGRTTASALVGSYSQLTSESLPALPLFTLAGFLLAEGRATDRLLRLFRACFGWMPGGSAIVATTLCAFFTVLTGGSGITILALGGLLLPTLIAEGYRPGFSLGLITAAGSLGLLFPPALPLILYGLIAEVPIGDLFLGGLLPGLVMLVALSALGVREGLAAGATRSPFRWREAATASRAATWELLVPVVVLGSLFIGANPVQASALTALYALIVQRFVHRDFRTFADVRRVMSDSISLVGGVLVILAVAKGLTSYIVYAGITEQMVNWVRSSITSPAMFLLVLNGFLLVVGCLMDIFTAIVVVVPLIVPIATEFQIDPVRLGIIFVANLELGYLTPPVGLNLFVSSYRFNKPVLEVARAALPMLIVLAVMVLLITYVPWLTTGFLQR